MAGSSPTIRMSAALPEMVRADADARNLAVCARTPAALARVLPRLFPR